MIAVCGGCIDSARPADGVAAGVLRPSRPDGAASAECRSRPIALARRSVGNLWSSANAMVCPSREETETAQVAVMAEFSTDSKSARDVSYNPEHHDRMKHVERRHLFVRDMVEKLEIEVPYVRTDDNAADMLTKPMKNPAKFFAFRAIIMNERNVLAATSEAAALRVARVSRVSAQQCVTHLESRGGV